MTTLFDNQPVKGLRPDGKIERRGRPRLRDAQGNELCHTCKQPKNAAELARKTALEEAANEISYRVNTMRSNVTIDQVLDILSSLQRSPQATELVVDDTPLLDRD